MQRLEVSCAVRDTYITLVDEGLIGRAIGYTG